MLNIFCRRTQKLSRLVFNQCSCNFSENPSSKNKLPDNNTEKPQDRSESLEKIKKPEVKKEDLVWRTPWHQKNVTYYDTLRAFYTEDNNISLLKWAQQPINLSPSAIKAWFKEQLELRERLSQGYNPERHRILAKIVVLRMLKSDTQSALGMTCFTAHEDTTRDKNVLYFWKGPELACAHFIVYRGGAVKFHNEDKWIKAVDGNYSLPHRYQSGMFLQAIDCTDMALRYEGLDNLRELQNLEWLSLNACDHMDDFCMDVITNIFSHSLLYLDLRNCFNITERGLGALYKMNHLKILYLDDMLKDTRYEMTCLLLEEVNQALEIKSDVVTFEIK